MIDSYNTSGSDQEELVSNSGSELDDDISDIDDVQFSFCKINTNDSQQINSQQPGRHHNNSNNNDGGGGLFTTSSSTIYSETHRGPDGNLYHMGDGDNKIIEKSKCAILGIGLGLFVTSFTLLILFPLYYQQLAVGGDEYNAYGAILYLSFVITCLLVVICAVVGWIKRFHIKFYKFPLPPRRLLPLTVCCGFAGTILTISSYRRVPCHLQDPLKGAALVYSLIFYFFFCRKVMGLQRIFSATTAVVGLFISVDYGLCDEFRCRGIDVTNFNFSTSTTSGSSVAINQTAGNTDGWQSRAVWTLFYVVGIALWTLHLSLLEGNIITTPEPINRRIPKISFLKTISRNVSNAEIPTQIETPILSTGENKTQPKPTSIHLALWIHLTGLAVFIFIGWVDIIPRTGQATSLSQFWSNTENSFLCHFNIPYEVPDVKNHHNTLEYLSNLTPYSILFNRTVQNLRAKRNANNNTGNNNLNTSHHKYHHDNKRNNNNHSNNNEHYNDENTTNGTTQHDRHNTMKKPNGDKSMKKLNHKHRKQMNHSSSSTSVSVSNNNNNNNNTAMAHKQELLTSVKVSHLILKSNRVGNCSQVRLYSWILIAVYITFVLLLLEFLIMSESAVFTVAVTSGALPLIGIFWSMFKLTNHGQTAKIIWSPEITGELICSLLGTPIIFLGLALLCRAHFNEAYNLSPEIKNGSNLLRNRKESIIYNSLTSRVA